jgi:hypothetical protein
MSGSNANHKAAPRLFDTGPIPLDCGQIKPLLTGYLLRELGDGQTTLVREHLLHCEECCSESELLSSTLSLLREGDPGDRAPAMLSELRRERLRWAWAHPFLAWCARWHIWIALSVALLGLIGAFYIVRHWRMEREPPDAIKVELSTPAEALRHGFETLPELEEPGDPEG